MGELSLLETNRLLVSSESETWDNPCARTLSPMASTFRDTISLKELVNPLKLMESMFVTVLLELPLLILLCPEVFLELVLELSLSCVEEKLKMSLREPLFYKEWEGTFSTVVFLDKDLLLNYPTILSSELT